MLTLLNKGKSVASWFNSSQNGERETLSQACNRIFKKQLITLQIVEQLQTKRKDSYNAVFKLLENGYVIEDYFGIWEIYEPGVDIEEAKKKIEDLEDQIADLKEKLRNRNER